MITPAQCRAARALLDWNQRRLADAAGVGINTLRDFEGDKRKPINNNLIAIAAALEAHGIRLVNADDWIGVMRKDKR